MAQTVKWTVLLDVRTAEEWAAETMVIPKGYFCGEQETAGAIPKVKIGDGVNTYANLSYVADDKLPTEISDTNVNIIAHNPVNHDTSEGTPTSAYLNLQLKILKGGEELATSRNVPIGYYTTNGQCYLGKNLSTDFFDYAYLSNVYSKNIESEEITATTFVRASKLEAEYPVGEGSYMDVAEQIASLVAAVNTLASRVAALDGGASTVIN